MRPRLPLLLYSAAAVIYALDRITKVLAEQRLRGRPPVEIVPGVVQLRFTTNPGGAFGLFGGAAWLFILASLVVIVAVIVSSRRLPSALAAVSLGFVLGGALGNLTDRVIRGPGFAGEVVDFIDFQVWPVFNLADSAIVVGAALLLLASFRRESDGREQAPSEPRRGPRPGAEPP
ncbi:MAG TPA: signal peptidase II [Actinomycetota bacterium]|nr:signal peptidase II [Actinomycetota bacterium]